MLPSSAAMTLRLLLTSALVGAVCLTGCDGGGRVTTNPPNLANAGGETPADGLSTQRAPLGEVIDGFPSDHERMVLVLTNLARHSAKNLCGDWTAEQGADVKKRPLTYSHVGTIAARYTSEHMADIGCFQHESCCVLGNVGGQVECTAPANCDNDTCGKSCTGGTSTSGRYGLLGMNTWSGENIARGYPAAIGEGGVWCGWMNSDGHRANIYSNHTELGVGMFAATNSCGRYWTQAFGSGNTSVPRIPAASVMHGATPPQNATQMYFAANYYDSSGAAPKRAAVVVDGHCFDLTREWGYDDNGTFEARFEQPDDIPPGCHPYYFLFVDGDAQRHTYPDTGSLHVALGKDVSCPNAFTPGQKPADCETGVQTCEEGDTRSCYTGPPGTLGVGECREGYQVCMNGFWSACRQQRAPAPEQCDGLDNDCDGETDEGNPGGGGAATCMVPEERGECRKGVLQCIAGGHVCVSVQGPQPEVCDGLDNDCDGVEDDGLGSIFCGQGECFRQVPACINGNPQECVPGEPQPEADFPGATGVGDNRDNDCNGLIDDGMPCGNAGTVRLCYSGSLALPDGGTKVLVPPCQRGVQTCGADGNWGECVGEILPSQEICDGKDNDCDGTIDDPIELGHERCGAGKCVNTGPACRQGKPSACEPRAASAETCNGVDDNCDGTVDEACVCRDGDEKPCYAGPRQTIGVGACVEGKRRCTAGEWTTCQEQVTPGIEYCNQIDDDCDGETDEQCIPLPDSGTDGGVVTAPDAGDVTGEEPGGCSCAAGAGGAGALPFFALAFGLLMARMQRRQP